MADALLDGTIDPDDAPPEYTPVAMILQAASAPASADESGDPPEEIRRIFEEARRGHGAPSGSSRPQDRRARSSSVKTAIAVVIAGLTVGGGVAAAETGHLPGPAQAAASRVLTAIGITVPDGSGGHAHDGSSSDPQDPATATTSSLAGSTSPTDADGSLPGRGDEVCAAASDGTCRSGEQGQAGDPHPSDTAPGQGGDSPGASPPTPAVTHPTGPPSTQPAHPGPAAPTPSPTTPPQPSASVTTPASSHGGR